MKKTLLKTTLVLAALVVSSVSLFGQAMKPKIMVMPADIWCNKNGYTTTFDNMGTPEMVPDYKKALQNDEHVRAMMSGIADFMQQNDFMVESLEQALKNYESDAAFDMVSTSKEGDIAAESPKDKLLSQVKPDIILDLDFSVKKVGPKQQIDFNLQAVDAFSGKVISGNLGHGTPSTPSEITNQLQEAVLSFKDKFLGDLMNYFNSMFTDGREIVVDIRRWDGCPIDFEEEIGDEELGMIIEDWMAENTVKGRYTPSITTENRMKFDQVRIPVYDEKGKAQDARRWGRELQKFLKKTTGMDCKLVGRGLGQVTLYIGGK
jgi:hypothetical protein